MLYKIYYQKSTAFKYLYLKKETVLKKTIKIKIKKLFTNIQK